MAINRFESLLQHIYTFMCIFCRNNWENNRALYMVNTRAGVCFCGKDIILALALSFEIDKDKVVMPSSLVK